MRVVSLQISLLQQSLLSDNQKTFEFDPRINIVFSKENSAGKTTLLRMLMYAMGYPIPSTRGIRFSDYETVLTVIGTNEQEFALTRNCDYIEVTYDRNEKGFSLPVDQNELLSLIFGIENPEVIENLLGTFYIDQEKGWTLLNRGKVIGNIHFSIESLLHQLNYKIDFYLFEIILILYSVSECMAYSDKHCSKGLER